MVLLYGECGRTARSAARLYKKHFSAGPHPSYQTILSVVKRLRKTGCVTSRARYGRPAKVRRQVQPKEVLAYALTYPKYSSRQIRENCGLSKSQVRKSYKNKTLIHIEQRLSMFYKTGMPIDTIHGATFS